MQSHSTISTLKNVQDAPTKPSNVCLRHWSTCSGKMSHWLVALVSLTECRTVTVWWCLPAPAPVCPRSLAWVRAMGPSPGSHRWPLGGDTASQPHTAHSAPAHLSSLSSAEQLLTGWSAHCTLHCLTEHQRVKLVKETILKGLIDKNISNILSYDYYFIIIFPH